MNLKELLDAQWIVNITKLSDGSYYADAVPIGEDRKEDWSRFTKTTDMDSPETALKILAAKALGEVIDYPQ